MFTEIAPVYDLVKSHRNYTAEAAVIRGLIEQYNPQARTVGEVACGTGSLLAELRGLDRVGVDASSQMLDVARRKLGSMVELHHGRMEDFWLPCPGVEVLLCLDGAIGYLGSAELEPTLSRFARHMLSGGLLIIEPWFTPEEWEPGKIHVTHHHDEVTTVVRVGHGQPSGAIDFHTVIGTSAGLHAFDEHYDFTLHPSDAMPATLARAGFTEVRKEAAPYFGRGLWVARKS